MNQSPSKLPNRRPAFIAAVVVAVIAVAVRIPSCYQSFWVDELHSAWCIWGSIADVMPRSAIGNQSPVYFYGLWCWKQLFGGGELALRMTSVLATSSAAALLTVGVARHCHSVFAGVVSGLVIAIDSNAIFFGTELRPYSLVILVSVAATLCFLKSWFQPIAARRNKNWVRLIVLVLVAFVIQPTSAGTLGWLILVLMIRRIVLGGIQTKFGMTSAMLAIVCSVVVAGLWYISVGHAWQMRSQWSAFASAPEFYEAFWLWDWTWLAGIPMVILVVHRWLARKSKVANPSQGIGESKEPAFVLLLICVLCTLTYWAASRLDLVHLWSRRYLIGLLPMFAIVVGSAVAGLRSTRGGVPDRRITFCIQATIAIVLLTGLSLSQGVARTLIRRPQYLAYRGEGWREAVEWLNQSGEQEIKIDAGLIEAEIFLEPDGTIGLEKMSPLMQEYLVCVVRGPYQLDSVQVTAAKELTGSSGTFLKRGRVDDRELEEGIIVALFGNVTAVKGGAERH